MHLSTVYNLVRSFGSKVFLSKKSIANKLFNISSSFILINILILALTFNSSLGLTTTAIARQNAVTNLLQKLGLSNLLDSKVTAQAQAVSSSFSSSSVSNIQSSKSSLSSVSSSSTAQSKPSSNSTNLFSVSTADFITNTKAINPNFTLGVDSVLDQVRVYDKANSKVKKWNYDSNTRQIILEGQNKCLQFVSDGNAPKLVDCIKGNGGQEWNLTNVGNGSSSIIRSVMNLYISQSKAGIVYNNLCLDIGSAPVGTSQVDDQSLVTNYCDSTLQSQNWTLPTGAFINISSTSSSQNSSQSSSSSFSSISSSTSSSTNTQNLGSILNSVNPNFGLGINSSYQIRSYTATDSKILNLTYNSTTNQYKTATNQCLQFEGFAVPPKMAVCDSTKNEQKWESFNYENNTAQPVIRTKSSIAVTGTNRNEQLCLDVDYWADGTFKNDQRVVSYYCWGAENQNWQIVAKNSSSSSQSSFSTSTTNNSDSFSYSQNGVNLNVAVACVDDGEMVNGQSSFSVVIKYVNNGGRIELSNSQLNPSRPVIHTHFDLKNRSTLNYADPAVANTLNGPITYFKNGNPAPATESKAMVIQGLGNESVGWKFNLLDTQGNSIKNSNGTTRDFEVSTNRNFATKCTQNSKRTITDNKIDTNPPFDPSFKFDPVYSTIVPTDTTQFNYKLSTADSTGTDNSEVKFTNSGIINDQQKWYFDSVSKLIKSTINNKCLATTGNQTWGKIIIKTCNSADNTQTWDISGNFIKNLASNNCINSQWSRIGTTDNYENKWYENRPAVLDNGCYWGFKFVSLPKTSSSISSQSSSSSSVSSSSSSSSQLSYNYIVNKVNSSFFLGNTSDTNIKSLDKRLTANTTNAKKWYYNSTTQQFKTSANQCLQNSGYNQPVTIQICSDTLESQKWLVDKFSNDSTKPIITTKQLFADYQGVQQKMCLDVNYWSAGGFADNQSLVAYTCWGGENQLWQLEQPNLITSWNLDWLKVLNPLGGIQASAETDQEYCTRASDGYSYIECNSTFNPTTDGRIEVYKFGGNSNFVLDHDSAGNVFLSEFNNSPTQKWKTFGTGTFGMRSSDDRCFTDYGLSFYNTTEKSVTDNGILGREIKLTTCKSWDSGPLLTDDGTLMLNYQPNLCLTVKATDNVNLSNKPIIIRPCPYNNSNYRSTSLEFTSFGASDFCFNFFKPVVFDRATQAQYEIARQGYACDPLYANASDEDLDEFSFGSDNETLEVIESAVQSNQETDVFKLAKQASDTTFGELQKVLEGVNTCGTWDVGCKTTNSTFQSSAITMANISGKLLFGLLVGIGSTIALDAIVKAILSSAFKIVGIFISIIGLIASTIAIFQNMGTILQSYINLPIEDKAYAVGNIIGGVLGTLVLGVDPSKVLDNVAQTIGTIASKASSINVKSITATLLAAKQSLIKFGLNVFEKSGKVVVKVNDLLKAIRSGGQVAFDELKVLLGGSEKYSKIALGFPKWSGKIRLDHIDEFHNFNTTNKKSKFIKNADYSKMVTEGVNKADTWRPVTSEYPYDSGTMVSSFVTEVEMGYQVGWSVGKTVPKNRLRIVIDEATGTVISAYPVS
jgi:hypothetical protein